MAARGFKPRRSRIQMRDELFIGRYRIDRRLGEGGMGTVYLAHDENIDRYVAIKMMRSESDDLLRRFKTEAKAAGRLKHPNIVTIYDFAVLDGVPCLIMEYVEGETLAKLIARNEPLTMAHKVDLIEQVCRALAFAHRSGIVHRDIKPANLMIERDGTIKILDFGIARTAAGSGTTGHMVGTVAYMSPEQALGRQVDSRSDIWALGLVLFEFVTGKLAFAGDSDYSVLDRIVRGQPEPFKHDDAAVVTQLKPIVARALAKDPADRYQSAESMARDLAEASRKLAYDESGTPTAFIPRHQIPPLTAPDVGETSDAPAQPAAAEPAVTRRPPTPEPPRRDPVVNPVVDKTIKSPSPPAPAAPPAAQRTAPAGVPRKFWAWAIPGALALAAGLWALRPQPAGVNPLDSAPAAAPPPVVAPAPDPAPPPAASTTPVTAVPEPSSATPVTPAVPKKDLAQETIKESRPADPVPPVNDQRAAPPRVDYSARIAAARDAFENGEYPVALQRYEAILKEDPDNSEATKGIQVVRAAQAAERKLFGSTATPATVQIDINARLAHARSRFEEGDYDAAIGAYEEVLKADPRNARALSGLSEARKAKAAEDAILKRPPKKPGV